jgi:hypothetical protein
LARILVLCDWSEADTTPYAPSARVQDLADDLGMYAITNPDGTITFRDKDGQRWIP